MPPAFFVFKPQLPYVFADEAYKINAWSKISPKSLPELSNINSVFHLPIAESSTFDSSSSSFGLTLLDRKFIIIYPMK